MPNKFEKLEQFQKINSAMAVCPVVKQKVMVTGLTVGDDINIRTMITSPDVYDREISVLIYNHTEFTDLPSKPTYEDFISHISHPDRKMLLWAIYTATYKTIKNANIKCEECDTTFSKNIDVSNLMTEDTVSIWDHDELFTNYTYEYTHNLSDELRIKIYFAIPSIKDHLDLLKDISLDTMQSNFERFDSILSKVDELILMIRKIEIVDDSDGVDELTDTSDIRTCIDRFIPYTAQEDMSKHYNEHFEKYNPIFTYKCECSNEKCKHGISFDIDIETMLFKRFLDI